MNRRSFLKRCSLLPFVGSLAAVGQSGAFDGRPVPLTAASIQERYEELNQSMRMWMTKDCLSRFVYGGVLPKDTEFGKDYNGFMIIEAKQIR